MKIKKYLLMVLVMIVTSVYVSSCGKDDDDSAKSSIQNYYIEIDVKGGGYDAAKINEFKAVLNKSVSGFTEDLKGLDKDNAIYIFDEIMKEFKSEFSNGMSGVDGNLEIIFYMKTVDGGNILKKSTLTITKDGCSLGK